MTYTYDPTKIRKGGKDQMRFELGDTTVSTGENGCALSDEEYLAFLEDENTEGTPLTKQKWLALKVSLVEAILHKFSFQVDTKIDVLSYDFSSRVEHWQTLYATLKKELERSTALPIMGGKTSSPPYFKSGMQSSPLTVPPFSWGADRDKGGG